MEKETTLTNAELTAGDPSTCKGYRQHCDGCDYHGFCYIPHKVVEMMLEQNVIDVTGAELAPGYPEHCQGNGKHPDFEICCDECDYFLKCFPEWEKGNKDDE